MIDLTIHGLMAIGKERPRYNFHTHTTYTPKKTQDYEKRIRQEFLEYHTLDEKYISEPLECKITAYYKIPTSYTKKRKKELIGQPCMNQKDIDNISKAIMDALNGYAYNDDRQIVKLEALKMYDENEDRIEISIREYIEE